MPKPIYQRVLLKLSGEALQGNTAFGIDPTVLSRLVSELSELVELKIQLGIVIGGGNMFRGRSLVANGLGRVTGDQLGMLATVMNALVLRDALEAASIPTRVMSAIAMNGVVDQFDRRKAIHHLQQQRVVLFAAGTGNPLVTTDSAASLRAIEIEADVLLKATNVDGVYSADPMKNPDATLYKRLSFDEVVQRELGVMDLAAFTQCRDHNVKLRIFNIHKHGALLKVVTDLNEGTLVEKF